MYEEQLDPTTIQGAVEAISRADMLVILGTSLIVYPAASFVRYFKGDHLTVINKTPIQLQGENVLVFEDTINNVFGQLEVRGN